MKVNTDSHILGGLCTAENPKNILDIGSGTGILSLMLAQKFENASVFAIEIETQAAIQTALNFTHSPWKNRLSTINDSFQNYGNQINTNYFDVIISNPPYFINSKSNKNQKKAQARHADDLPLEELAFYCSKLLTQNGSCWIIYPYINQELLLKSFNENQMYPNKIFNILYEHNEQAARRQVFMFTKQKKKVIYNDFKVYKTNRSYTDECTKVLQPYHLYL